jgi:hypothetical protein
MAKRTGLVDKSYIINSPVPEQTKSYTPIPHQFVIDIALDTLKNKGFVVNTELYIANMNAHVASAKYLLNYGDDPEMGMMFAWSNSYDKTMRFKCAIGAYNKNNMNAIVSADMGSYKRVHKGTADKDTQTEILAQIANAEMYYSELMRDKEIMKNISVNKKICSELLGRIYMEHDLLTDEQMAIVKNEFYKPTFDYEGSNDSLWTFYNHILFALQKSHPRDWMDQQTLVHWFLCKEMNILHQVIQPQVVNAEPVQPDNQLTIMDQLQEMGVEETINPES